jgi:hypothetical protein
MPRRNTASHGRRLKAHPAAFAGEPNAIGPEGMARSLVERGLASELILDHPRQDTANNRTERRNNR